MHVCKWMKWNEMVHFLLFLVNYELYCSSLFCYCHVSVLIMISLQAFKPQILSSAFKWWQWRQRKSQEQWRHLGTSQRHCRWKETGYQDGVFATSGARRRKPKQLHSRHQHLFQFIFIRAHPNLLLVGVVGLATAAHWGSSQTPECRPAQSTQFVARDEETQWWGSWWKPE